MWEKINRKIIHRFLFFVSHLCNTKGWCLQNSFSHIQFELFIFSMYWQAKNDQASVCLREYFFGFMKKLKYEYEPIQNLLDMSFEVWNFLNLQQLFSLSMVAKILYDCLKGSWWLKLDLLLVKVNSKLTFISKKLNLKIPVFPFSTYCWANY